MQEIGIETSILTQILRGRKTIEPRLRTSKFVTIRTGDKLSIREDTWDNDKIVVSTPNRATVKVTETRFFESFSDMFEAIGYKAALPGAISLQEAIANYRQFYTPAQEREFGVVAISFTLVSP